jgi:phage portal protein BeeE
VTRLWDRWLQRDAGFWEGMASGAATLTTTYGSPDREAILPVLAANARRSYTSNSPVFAAELVRTMLLAEAVFVLQAKDDKHLFGNTSLRILEEPWPDGSSGELIARCEQDGALAGNAYIWRPPDPQDGHLLVRLRPDWVTIISKVAYLPGGGSYRRKLGYWVEPPKSVADEGAGEFYPAEEVAHWVPVGMEDPEAAFRGMSWLTPVAREIAADEGLTGHKIKYLEHAASPNLLLKYAQKLAPGTVDRIRERVTARYGGVDNAYRTLVLDQGADATVVGNSLQQMDFSNVEGAGEQRILAASGVPGVLVGLEPLRGAGRGYQESMQKLANLWARPQWRSLCKALEKFVDDPTVQAGGTRLWFDTSDIAALQDGEMEKGQAALVRAQALLALVQAGYTHESAVLAVDASDLSQLQAGGVGTPTSGPQVQHLLGQTQPGVVASPLPPTLGRLPVGPTSPGGNGDGSRPVPRPASARRALEGSNGHV